MYIIIIIFVVLLIMLYFDYKFSYWKRKGVYYLKPTIPFGNTHPLKNFKISKGEHFKYLYDEFKKANRPYGGFYVCTTPVLLLTDPELIKTILIKDCKYFYERGFRHEKYIPQFFRNLSVLSGRAWKVLRSKTSILFTENKMKTIFDTFLESTENLDTVLNENELIDVQDITSRLIINNIAVTTYGYNDNTLINKKSIFYHNSMITEILVFNKLSQLYMFLPKLILIGMPCNFMRLFKIKSYFKNLLKNNMKYREDNNVHKNDYLDEFMKLMKKRLCFNEVFSTAILFLIAGYHSTKSISTFGLLHLSLNQNIQNKLRKNIEDTLEKHQGNITYDSIMEMDYLEQVVCEILRMYPIIHLLFRDCNEDYKIKNSDVIIEKDTRTYISVLGLHMDPEFYPNPTEFNPDRFTQEEIAKRKPFTYLPFGEGHKKCIGKRFGLLQIKVVLVKFIKSYRVTVDPKTILPVEFDPNSLFLTPKTKIWLNVTKITEKY